MRNELARFYHYRTSNCLPPRKLRRDIPRDADQAAEERPAFHQFVRFDRVLLSKALRAMYHNLSPVKTGVVSLDSVYGSTHSSDAPLAHG